MDDIGAEIPVTQEVVQEPETAISTDSIIEGVIASLIATSIVIFITCFWKRENMNKFIKRRWVGTTRLFKSKWGKITGIFKKVHSNSDKILILENRITELEKEFHQYVQILSPGTTFEKSEGLIAGTRQILTIDGMQLAFRYCPPGEFMMGTMMNTEEIADKYQTDMSPNYGNAPQHKVKLTQGFYLAECPVTRGEFQRFVDETNYEPASEKRGTTINAYTERGWRGVKGLSWRAPGFEQKSDHPAVCINYYDALAYVQWLNKNSSSVLDFNGLKPVFHLPTEAQWEYACRAGTTTEFFWGDEEKDGEGYLNAAGTENDPCGKPWKSRFSFNMSYAATSPVRGFKANPWGLYGMLGNVYEWCHDWYGIYQEGDREDPTGSAVGDTRVIRGGAWNSSPGCCRCAYRGNDQPERVRTNYGVRVAFSLK